MKKYKLSRQAKALIACGIFLLLLAANIFIGSYGFSPDAAYRQVEESTALAPLTKLTDLPKLNIPAVTRRALLYNDDCIVHAMARFSPFMGWFRDGQCILDCSEPAPAYYGLHCVSNHKTGVSQYVFFGRIDDENISSAKISITDHSMVSISPEDMIDNGAYRCFVLTYEMPNPDGVHLSAFPATFYDADGNLIYTTDCGVLVSTSIIND